MAPGSNLRRRRAGGPPTPSGSATPAEPERLHPQALAAPVLVVEDEAMIAWMLESLLEDMGFTTITVVATAEEALDTAFRLSPGLIVSDINLGPGGLDGIAAAATIRSRLPASVLFISGHASPEALDRIRQEVPGALVLRKPVTPDVLRRAVIRLVERRPPH